MKAVALSSVVGSFLAAGNANAAMEVAQLAASDNRLSILATLFLPAIGWVLFNIGAPRDIAECPPTHVNELHGDTTRQMTFFPGACNINYNRSHDNHLHVFFCQVIKRHQLRTV